MNYFIDEKYKYPNAKKEFKLKKKVDISLFFIVVIGLLNVFSWI